MVLHYCIIVERTTLYFSINEPLEVMADEDLIQTSGEDIHHNEPLLQVGRGQKRSVDEVNDGAGTSDEVSGNNVFTMTHAKQVTVKNFSTACMDYTAQFTDTFAHLELSEIDNHLHEIFENLLRAITKDIAGHDQVRFVLRVPSLSSILPSFSSHNRKSCI